MNFEFQITLPHFCERVCARARKECWSEHTHTPKLVFACSFSPFRHSPYVSVALVWHCVGCALFYMHYNDNFVCDVRACVISFLLLLFHIKHFSLSIGETVPRSVFINCELLISFVFMMVADMCRCVCFGGKCARTLIIRIKYFARLCSSSSSCCLNVPSKWYRDEGKN